MKEHKKVEVSELPKCDFCGATAHYDGRTETGQWGYMCLPCFGVHGIRLGLGCGQELKVKNE